MTPNTIHDPLELAQLAQLLAPAFSEGRRMEARLCTGDDRAFFTSKGCSRVFVPFPLTGGEASLRTAACGIALQASPSKEAIAVLPLDDLRPTELSALTFVEGEAALAWAIERWPGLESDLRRRLPGLSPGPTATSGKTAAIDGRALLDAALRLIRENRGFQVPVLLGSLVGGELPRRSLRSYFRGKGRMPYSLRKNQPVPTLFGVPVGGSGGVSSKNIPPPSGGEDDPETRAERRIGIPYDEWNFHTRRYRRGHVSVIEERAPVESRQLEPPPPEVMRWFCKSPTRAWHRKLDDGTDLDLDAYVDQYCATVAGNETDGRIYQALGEGERDVATALLLDGSASLGADGGLHLRLQLACADALASGLARAGEPHAVFAFTGDTRHRVEVRVLKDFDEPRAVLPGRTGLSTAGYTRLGAPIRHLTRRLLQVPAERRILLSLGDGLPSDEGYEGRYAWCDVAQSVKEAEEAGVLVYHIAVGRVRIDPLQECFGSQRSQRISSLRDLPRVLAQVHEGLCEQ